MRPHMTPASTSTKGPQQPQRQTPPDSACDPSSEPPRPEHHTCRLVLPAQARLMVPVRLLVAQACVVGGNVSLLLSFCCCLGSLALCLCPLPFLCLHTPCCVNRLSTCVYCSRYSLCSLYPVYLNHTLCTLSVDCISCCVYFVCTWSALPVMIYMRRRKKLLSVWSMTSEMISAASSAEEGSMPTMLQTLR